MTRPKHGLAIPARIAGLGALCAAAFALLMTAGAAPATAAPAGLLEAVGKTGLDIGAASRAEVIKVGKRHKSRRHRGRKHRGHRHRRHRGSSFHLRLGVPMFYSYPRYRSYTPYRARPSRCSYWSRRCAGNWGYGNSNYYGCLRYHGC